MLEIYNNKTLNQERKIPIKITKISLALFSTTLLFACAKQDIDKIESGMNRTEVIEIMGEPDYIETNSDEIYETIQPTYEVFSSTLEDLDDSDLEQRDKDKLLETVTGTEKVINALSENKSVERYEYVAREYKHQVTGEMVNIDFHIYMLKGRVLFDWAEFMD